MYFGGVVDDILFVWARFKEKAIKMGSETASKDRAKGFFYSTEIDNTI